MPNNNYPSGEDTEILPHLLDIMLQKIDKKNVIFDPFYSQGFAGRHMKSKGYQTHHDKTIDFFDTNSWPKHDIMVSCPPFKKLKKNSK